MRCVDTSFCIDFIRGDHGAVALARELEAAGEQISVPSPVVTEFLTGAYSRKGKELEKSIALFERLSVAETSYAVALEAARIGGECIRKGEPRATLDLLVAATAVSLRCPLVTRDRDFSSIPGLILVTY